MKKYFLVLMCLASTCANAQDKIITRSNSVLEVKVTEVGDEIVKYKRFTNQDGPVYSMPKKDIFTIWYENGEEEKFDNSAAPSPSAPSYNKPDIHRLDAGTQIPLQNINYVKAADLRVGQPVNFRVARDIKVDGIDLIPYGTPVKGIVYETKKSSWFGTKGRLGIKINAIDLPNGLSIPVNNGDIYVTGKNRTPLSVVLFLLVTWPACFITGSKAELPAGYEIVAQVANPVEITMDSGQLTAVSNTSSTPTTISATQTTVNGSPMRRATIVKKNSIVIEALVISDSGDMISYKKKGKPNGTTYFISKSDVGRIDYK